MMMMPCVNSATLFESVSVFTEGVNKGIEVIKATHTHTHTATVEVKQSSL